jgi:uncharacterized protein (DUF305 family)
MKPTLIALAAVAALAAGSASAQPATDHSKMDHANPSAGGHMAAADKAFMTSMQKMHKDMMAAKGKTVDASFARKMIAHHEGAIDMAKIELEHGADAKTKQMAQKVIDESNRGIAELRDWLRQHGG